MSVVQSGRPAQITGRPRANQGRSPEITASPSARSGRTGALLLGMSFIGSEAEVRSFLYGPNFMTQVCCAVKMFLGRDANLITHVYVPTQPLRIEEAARLTASECRHFSHSFLECIKRPEGIQRWQGGLFSHHFSDFNDSVGFVVPIVVTLRNIPVRALEAHPIAAIETMRGGLQMEQLDDEIDMDADEDEGNVDGLLGFSPFPPFEIMSVNHFLPACREGIERALLRHRDRFANRIERLRDDGYTAEGALCGVDFAVEMDGDQKVVLATNWIQDDTTRQQLALMIRDAVSPDVPAKNLMSDAHYWTSAAELAMNQRLRRSGTYQDSKMH